MDLDNSIAFSPWPAFTEEEAEKVTEILLSNRVNYWTGEEARQFEEEFSSAVACKYGVALANGTVALELALRVLGIGPGDEVVVTPRTFIASVSSIVNVGAIPVFADVDPDSQNITADTIRPVITNRSRAIICVHLAGWPCEMEPIMELATQHDLKIIEDCAQAHGAVYKGVPVGAWGDIAAWSFCQDKIISTGGEGGMLTTNDFELYRKAWEFKDHGKSLSKTGNADSMEGFRWLHDSFGSNLRITELQAAIGRIQLKRLREWHKKRLSHANAIWSFAKKLQGIRVSQPPEYVEHAAYKCYLFVQKDEVKLRFDRDRILSEIIERGVPCMSGSCPEVYLEKAFLGSGYSPQNRLPVARVLGETSLMFLVHPTLTAAHIEKTCEALEDVMTIAIS